MTSTLHNQIELLKTKLLDLGAEVEKRVHYGIKAIDDRDAVLSEEIIREDEKINEMEVDLEEECLKILALYQPVAIDLRYIVAILKINNDLERIGDLAVNLADRAIFLANHKAVKVPFKINDIGQKVETMLESSLFSLIRLDSNLAREVLDADDEVDQLKFDIHHFVEDEIRQSPDRLECLIQILLAARHLERIADHATNIAEDVIYLVEGVIVRHTN